MSERAKAKAEGKTRYRNGKQCPRGHLADRMVSNGRCCYCISEDKKRARERNPSQHREYMRKWHAKNKDSQIQYRKDNRDSLNENTRRWRAENPDRDKRNRVLWISKNLERYKRKSREWRVNNRVRDRELNKRWRENNPEKQRVIMFNRNCATRGVRQAVRHGLITSLMQSQGSRCVYCGCDVSSRYHIDHKLPVSRGGDNSEANLQILCPTCNLRKGSKTHVEFLEKIKEDVSHAT